MHPIDPRNQQAPPHPAPYPRPPYPPAQYPPAQYPPAQYPSAQYPPAPGYGMYGPGMYGPPPKRRRSTGLVVSLVSTIAVVAALVTVLVVAPWKSDAPTESTATYDLADGIKVQLRVPTGWSVTVDSNSDGPLLVINRDGDKRNGNAMLDDLRSLEKAGSGTPVHTVVVFSGPCPTWSSTDPWTTKPVDLSNSRHTARWVYASSQFDKSNCIRMSAVDAATDARSAGTQANDLARRMITEDRISASKPV